MVFQVISINYLNILMGQQLFNLALYMKELKLLGFSIFVLKIVASSSEWNNKRPVILEWFELYFIRFCIGITKSTSSSSSIVVPSIAVIHLVNGAQF